MPEEVTNSSEVKKTSDGNVKISLEAYNDLQTKAAAKPPVIYRTVNKTEEMAAKEYRVWGGTFMGLGASLFTIGGLLFKAGRL